MTLYIFIQYLLLILLGSATLYIFLFSAAGLLYRQKAYAKTERFSKIVVLIPGYREDAVIIEAASSALKQKYPKSSYDVVIIADSFEQNTLDRLKILPVKVVEVQFEKSTKTKALNKGMEKLMDDYDIAVVLDADNIMETDFLEKINAAFEQGYIAVQGHRTAKNVNTSLAILDAISEEINNHIFRKGHRVLGLSSAIIGSGMAFRYHYFKDMMLSVTAVGGFDKEIELKMLKEGIKIAYLDDAFVYDEKVQQSGVFSNQRRRWLSAQFHYFRAGFTDAVKHLFTKGNVDYFDKALQFIQPPRILLLGMVLLLGSLFILLNNVLHSGYYASVGWAVVMISCVAALLFAVPRSFFKFKTVIALAGLPRGMLLMLLSLLKIKGANKTFIHTRHNSTTVETKY
jgi:cellulose synthase/poly-beta-1,6-N-acetylglucosamine synthase-like glycosyltransferase